MQPDDNTLITLSSWSLTEPELIQAASCVVPSRKIACELPRGLTEVAMLEQTGLVDFAAAFAPTSLAGHGVGFQDDVNGRLLGVLTFVGGSDELLALRWQAGPDADEIDGAGEAAWVASGNDRVVIDEGGGVLVAMQGAGLSDSELTTAARSLAPATDAEWAALTAKTASLDALPAGATLIGQGSHGTTVWRAFVDGDGGVCGDITIDGASTSSCSGSSASSEPPIDAIESPAVLYGDDSVRLYAGRISGAVTGVSVVPDSSTAVLVAAPVGWYAALVTGPKTTVTFSAIDVDGATLGAVTIDETAPQPGLGPGASTTTTI